MKKGIKKLFILLTLFMLLSACTSLIGPDIIPVEDNPAFDYIDIITISEDEMIDIAASKSNNGIPPFLLSELVALELKDLQKEGIFPSNSVLAPLPICIYGVEGEAKYFDYQVLSSSQGRECIGSIVTVADKSMGNAIAYVMTTANQYEDAINKAIKFYRKLQPALPKDPKAGLLGSVITPAHQNSELVITILDNAFPDYAIKVFDPKTNKTTYYNVDGKSIKSIARLDVKNLINIYDFINENPEYSEYFAESLAAADDYREEVEQYWSYVTANSANIEKLNEIKMGSSLASKNEYGMISQYSRIANNDWFRSIPTWCCPVSVNFLIAARWHKNWDPSNIYNYDALCYFLQTEKWGPTWPWNIESGWRNLSIAFSLERKPLKSSWTPSYNSIRERICLNVPGMVLRVSNSNSIGWHYRNVVGYMKNGRHKYMFIHDQNKIDSNYWEVVNPFNALMYWVEDTTSSITY